jgi:hypothetical protein
VAMLPVLHVLPQVTSYLDHQGKTLVSAGAALHSEGKHPLVLAVVIYFTQIGTHTQYVHKDE